MNSLGKAFKITCFGESHGNCIGVVIDGCPAGLPLELSGIQQEVDRRRAGSGPASTARREKDRVEIWSGVFNGLTSGVPICLVIRNEDVDDTHYDELKNILRPGHADFTARLKYGGFHDYRGGGVFSGRRTAAYVMAGAVARGLLTRLGIEIMAHTVEIGGIRAAACDYEAVRKASSDQLRCADVEASVKMNQIIQNVKAEGDSVGGIIEGIALNAPAGLGEPVFDGLDSELAKALFSIPAVKGVEFGAGFESTRMKGSENNDEYVVRDGKIVTVTNNAGGMLGGISSGMPLIVRVAVKPTPSILKEQKTVDTAAMNETTLRVAGRHDACIVPRAVAVVEAMMAVTLCDLALRAGMIPGVMK